MLGFIYFLFAKVAAALKRLRFGIIAPVALGLILFFPLSLYAQYYKCIGEDVPVKIRVFGKKARFMGYQEEISPFVSEVGFYSVLYNEAVINGERDKDEVIATIYHEANHAILTEKAPEVPLWINEGLAEYFERIVPKNDSVTIGHQDRRQFNLAQSLTAGNLPELSSYLSSWEGPWKQNPQAEDEENARSRGRLCITLCLPSRVRKLS